MPHKHKRKRDDDKSQFNLPPDVRARSLPVIQPTKDFLEPRKRPRLEKNGKARKTVDDTPKAFARLLAWHKDGKRLQPGLDSVAVGEKRKKNKRLSSSSDLARAVKQQDRETATSTSINSEQQPQPASNALKILPGESIAEFNVRVDQSLPLSTVPKRPSVKIPGVRDEKRLTKHNKKLARVQNEWRQTEKKLREKEEEENEANEEKNEEERMLWMNVGKSHVKGKKKRHDGMEDDPWKQLEKKRYQTKQKNLQDVVQAPPMLDDSKLRKMQALFKDKVQPKQDSIQRDED